MTKLEFRDRLILAGELARRFAASYVIDPLPELLCFTLARFHDPHGRPPPPGKLKFLGGRFVRPQDLRRLSADRAASLLWVDGRVPAWINIGVTAALATQTELILRFTGRLFPADENKLAPDVGCPPGNRLIPFRLRGPSMPGGWRSVELDGRVPLIPDPDATDDRPVAGE